MRHLQTSVSYVVLTLWLDELLIGSIRNTWTRNLASLPKSNNNRHLNRTPDTNPSGRVILFTPQPGVLYWNTVIVLRWDYVINNAVMHISPFCMLLLSTTHFNCKAPHYLLELLKVNTPSRILQTSSTLFFIEPKSRHPCGDRSFSSAAPRIWNSLPLCLRSCLCSKNVKYLLKTYLNCSRYSRTTFVVTFFAWFVLVVNTQQGGYVRITSPH